MQYLYLSVFLSIQIQIEVHPFHEIVTFCHINIFIGLHKMNDYI